MVNSPADKPRVLLVHPGTQHAPRLAEALNDRGLLHRFWTGWAVTADATGVRRLSAGRRVGIPSDKLRTRSWIEKGAQGLLRLGLSGEKTWHRRNALFQRLIPEDEIRMADVLIGFDTSSWILARRAKLAGKRFVLDQTVGDPLSRSLELEKLGLGSDVWPEAFAPRWPQLRRAERREHDLADAVVAAGSFSARTLREQGVPDGAIKIIPYGVGKEFLSVGATRGPWPRGAPTFLFVGHLSARKGIHFLLEAWRDVTLAGASLRLAGGGNLKRGKDGRPLSKVTFLGRTPRIQVLEEMKGASIFVFPSLFEGFGLVLLEAMAAGLPIITTPNTAGPDLITDGVEGLIVPAGDARALQQAMQILGSDPKRAAAMGCAAHEKAKQYTWARYGEEWNLLLSNLIEP